MAIMPVCNWTLFSSLDGKTWRKHMHTTTTSPISYSDTRGPAPEVNTWQIFSPTAEPRFRTCSASLGLRAKGRRSKSSAPVARGRGGTIDTCRGCSPFVLFHLFVSSFFLSGEKVLLETVRWGDRLTVTHQTKS